jgi:hypothetical protein
MPFVVMPEDRYRASIDHYLIKLDSRPGESQRRPAFAGMTACKISLGLQAAVLLEDPFCDTESRKKLTASVGRIMIPVMESGWLRIYSLFINGG